MPSIPHKISRFTRRILWAVAACLVIIGQQACKKDHEKDHGTIALSFHFNVDGAALKTGDTLYSHPAGYKFGVSRLLFYISNISLKDAQGNWHANHGAFLINGLSNSSQTIELPDMPYSNYKGIRFMIGLDTSTNKTDALPSTAENLNMAWPDGMGGGYHFMKLEGSFADSTGLKGYAMHIGMNGYSTAIDLPNKEILLNGDKSTCNLQMNVAEWFKNPALYDFRKDGNYIMGNAVPMKKISDNGRDVFNE